MQITVWEVSTQQFILALNNLKNILKKAEQAAKAKNFEMKVLLETRLFPDMLPLNKQIQISCDAAKFCGSRLTHVPAPEFNDQEQTLDEYFERIDKTIEYLKTLEASDFQEFETKRIKFPWHPGHELQGRDYLIQFAIPNFYFHLTTAYNILRSSGIEIGKADYLGKINWHQI